MTRRTTRRGFLKLTGAAAVGATVSTSAASATKGKHAVRYASYNVTDLSTDQVQTPGDEQAAAAARVIQEANPDVLLLNELTNNVQQGEHTERTNIEAFVENYLSVPQADHLEGIDYPHTLQPASNTGVLPETAYDFNKNGDAGDRPGDAYGFGLYPGHYAFAVASKHPIDEDAIRSFQTFEWADMPNNLIPFKGEDGVDTDGLYLTEAEAEVYRLSSKTHIDVPLEVPGGTVHGLFAHPTPPVFDGPNNFNGRWNHDEVRFFADYVAGADYIYDDSGRTGGLDTDASYVLMGDMNAGPGDEPLDPATKYFIENDAFETRRLPTSPSGARNGTPHATANFGDGGSHVDWVLPSPDLSLRGSSVVWPNAGKRGLGDAVRTASDHRLVWADVAVKPGR
ncbi:endonuclease/exonuclease/phosphatase family protein [Halarchaeum sp. P4]|uniref:endonuclease/exonuclease/phosphatase family protein n=1 Tax=Halarchaeum sp. P4 TaxID=3421639 RepID=UPI003EBB5B47